MGCEMGIYCESSERSDGLNRVKKHLEDKGYKVLAFEGYTVKNDAVSLLLDRFAFETRKEIYSTAEIFNLIKDYMGDDYDYKLRFAHDNGIRWYTLCYQYPDKSFLIEPKTNEVERIKIFKSFEEFGTWTYMYRDMNMKSRYEEDGLPQIDKILRKNKTPWPGNLDGLLVYKNEFIILLEYQRTSIKKVKDHSNNEYFLPNGRRKGDVNRWKVAEMISKSTKLPIMIIVWSDKEEVIRLKMIEKIVYPNETNKSDAGLVYYFDELINKDDIEDQLNHICENIAEYEVK